MTAVLFLWVTLLADAFGPLLVAPEGQDILTSNLDYGYDIAVQLSSENQSVPPVAPEPPGGGDP